MNSKVLKELNTEYILIITNIFKIIINNNEHYKFEYEWLVKVIKKNILSTICNANILTMHY